MGVFAPSRTPSAIIDRLYSELSVVLRSESLRKQVATLGYETGEMGMPPAEFGAFVRANIVKWTKVMRDLNIRAN